MDENAISLNESLLCAFNILFLEVLVFYWYYMVIQ